MAVGLVDLDGGRAEAVAAELPGSVSFACDVADEAQVADVVRSAHEQLGRIDGVFNAAGIADFGPIEEWTLARFNRMFGIHVGGTFLVTKNVVPIMREAGGGSIVNVASIAAITAQPGNAAYGAAKAAIAGLTRQLALDLAPTIRVNVIAPGRVRSGMTEPLYTQRGGSYEGRRPPGGRAQHDEAGGRARGDRKRCVLPASSDASFITGQTIVADGGDTLLDR